MSGEQLLSQEDYFREQYWWMPGTQKGILEFLGSQGSKWSQVSDCYSEFLGVANRQKLNREDKLSPTTIINAESLSYYLRNFRGQVELQASEWQRESVERPGYPSRTLLLWDIDFYDQNMPTWSVDNPKEAFELLEPTYQLMHHVLNDYGIPHLAVVSGRGYNFFTQIPATSPIMDELLSISGPLEPTVIGKQSNPYEFLKRRKPVPPLTESAHMAAARLQQFVFGQIIRQTRRHSHASVEVSDIGPRGIAFDNTTMVYTIENRITVVLGSPYFIKAERTKSGFHPTTIKIPRAGSGYELNIDDMLHYRNRYDTASNLLSQINCSIPDGSQGLTDLIEAYNDSDLKLLHEAMDSTFGDQPEQFAYGYHRYEDITRITKHPSKIYNLILGANDKLLEPMNINDFVWEVFEAWSNHDDPLSVAPHVAGLLRAIYEDPRFKWGHRWTKQTDALRYARGWVTIILGQAFEKKY